MGKSLSKSDRASLRAKFGGLCAYCGAPLGERWHADHVEPVMRETRYERGKGFVRTGTLCRPENDHTGNMLPACPPCNIDKHSFSLEQWRQKLQGSAAVLERNSSTYRHAKRFGLISNAESVVVFHFEKAVPNA